MENLTKRVKQILKSHPHFRWMIKENKKGFTLVELIVNMAIIGIIMVMVTTITSMSMNSFGNHKKNLDAVNLGNLILSTFENRIAKSGHAKLERYFEPVQILDESNNLIGYKDLNGDKTPDTIIKDSNGEEYPICLFDLQHYTVFFQKPDKEVKTNHDRNILTDSNRIDRKGKLYTIRAVDTAKLAPTTNPLDPGFEIEGYINDGNGKAIFVEPLLDESLYKGYLVDVTFQYISVHNDPIDEVIFGKITAPNGETEGTTPEGEGGQSGGEPELEPDTPPPPEPDLGGEGTPDGAPVGRLNCIKITVDIYDGNKKVHSVSGTITFIQRFFKMDQPYGDFVGDKDVLFIRA